MKALKNYKDCYLHTDGFIYKRVVLSLPSELCDQDFKKIKEFLSIFYHKSNEIFITLNNAFMKYDIYCNDNDIIAVGKSDFLKLLKKLNVKTKRTSAGNVVYLENIIL